MVGGGPAMDRSGRSATPRSGHRAGRQQLPPRQAVTIGAGERTHQRTPTVSPYSKCMPSGIRKSPPHWNPCRSKMFTMRSSMVGVAP